MIFVMLFRNISFRGVLAKNDATYRKPCMVPMHYSTFFICNASIRGKLAYFEKSDRIIAELILWVTGCICMHKNENLHAFTVQWNKQEGICAHPLKRVCLHSFWLHKQNCWTEQLRRLELVDWITGFCRALFSKGICNFSREIIHLMKYFFFVCSPQGTGFLWPHNMENFLSLNYMFPI